MNPSKYSKIAAEAASRKNARLGTVGLRSDGVLVCASDDIAPDREPSVHEEARVSHKLGASVFDVAERFGISIR